MISDEFYQCLSYDGCGLWISAFKSQGMVIGLRLKGLRRGRGYIELVYEGPKWSESVDAKDDELSKSDNEAL